jgi:hypothetical protein
MSDSTQRLLGQIENKEMVLPEFQREFTWNRKQSLELIDSLLKGYPIGSLLVWKTADVPALKNMPDFVANGRAEILLDGQQRLTALYMLIKDAIPPYYSTKDIEEGKDPRQLYFNLETRALGYYKQIEMGNNPRWVRVCDCFKSSGINLEERARSIAGEEGNAFEAYARINKNMGDLRGILDVLHPVMYVQEDANLKHALTVFDRVNSNGTPLGEADIALAHMCSAWPETRRVFKEKLAELSAHNFEFDLKFMIRAMNAVINGRADYKILHDATKEELISGWHALTKLLDYLVNFLRDRAYIYGTDDINTSNVLIPVIGYLSQNNLKFQNDRERRKLIYWMYAALYQARYSGSVDQKLERDLNALESEQPVDALIAILREDHGDPTVSSDNLDTRGVEHPLYDMMHVVIRARGGVDWSNGLSLERPFGTAYSVEKHHIFPHAVLSGAGYDTGKNFIHKKRVNEIANRVPLTRSGNMDVFDKPPAKYLPMVQQSNPGNLEKFMVPIDDELWKVENYEQFLTERRRLMAEAINEYMNNLLGNSAADQSVDPPGVTAKEVIAVGESETVEFKSTLRWNINAQRNDKEIEHSALKTISAFLNSDGGTLLIGVDDRGEALGLDLDQFPNDDRMMQHLTNIIKERMGAQHMRFLRLSVELVNEKKVFRVDCQRGVVPAYLKYNNAEVFYIRTGPATADLPVSALHDYINTRFYR